jgi:hypothetical protein
LQSAFSGQGGRIHVISKLTPYALGVTNREALSVTLIRREYFPRFRNITPDLLAERPQILEFLLRPQIAEEAHFDLFPVEIAVEIEDVKFEHSLRRAASIVGRTPRFTTPRNVFPSSNPSAA